MIELDFFDANCRLGVPMNGAWTCAPDIPDLLSEMDRVGVRRALVAAVNAAAAGAVYENALLSEKFARHAQSAVGRLFACWSILPEQCDELPHGQAFFDCMAEHNVRAVEMLPKSHRWVPRRVVVGPLFDRLAEAGIPILMRVHDEAGGWEGVYDIVERFPENRFIIASCGVWGCDRLIRPLLDGYKGVYFETGENWTAGGIESLVSACGHDQILYGSNYPRDNHGQGMLNIRHARISDEAKVAIAGGNLTRLLNIKN